MKHDGISGFPDREGNMKKILAALFVLLLMTILPGLAACAGEITSVQQLNSPEMRVGVDLGSAAEMTVREVLPKARIEVFNDTPSAYLAVAQGKLDAFVYDYNQMRIAIGNEVRGVHLLDETLGEPVRIAVGISPVTKIPDFENRLNQFIAWIRSDGTLDDMFRRWVIEGSESMPEIPAPENPEFLLTVGTSGIVQPYTYYIGTELSGYDIELARRFAAWLGAELRFKVYDYGAIIPACATGDVDCVMANLNITPERAEALAFSDVLYEERLGVMVRGGPAEVLKTEKNAAAASDGGDGTFLGGIVSSFHKTFIREGRWKLFAEGVVTTLVITLLSILLGTLLGFGVCLMCRNGNAAANGVTRLCVWLVQGMPMVVLLMVLYYIVFGSVAVSGAAVAVTGFTLTFGASVYGLLRMGIGAVDAGQYEAAYALGYPKRRTFFRIILPQALPHVLPAYRGEIVGLIKATAIVGYIAVQDLSKMGDIVRSRTYEAFFPLIAVTVIYFLLEGLLGFLVSRISASFNPKRRRPGSILKGLKTEDRPD